LFSGQFLVGVPLLGDFLFDLGLPLFSGQFLVGVPLLGDFLFDLGLPLFSGQFLVGVPLLGDFLFGLLLVLRILTDGGMCLFIHIFNAVSLDAKLDVSGELAFEGFVIILFKGFHVVSYMLAHDVGTMDVSVKLRFFLVVTRESFLAVGDFDAAIGSTLHGAKNTGSGGGTSKTDIQASTEGSRTIIIVFDHEVLSVDLGTACIGSIQVQLFEDPAGQKKTSAVGGSIVGKANLESITREFVAVGSGQNTISFETSISDLTTDILVGSTDNHAVLGGIILILVLNDKALAGIVIGLAFTAPPELNLEALEVSLILHYLNERHFDKT